MKVDLISKNERLEFRYGDSVFYYRRVTPNERKMVVRKHTRKGETDWTGVALDIVKLSLLGWDNIYLDGKKVNYDKELVELLPESLLIEIFDALNSPDTNNVEEIEKN